MNAIGEASAMTERHQSEVDRNFAAFQQRLPELLATHAGKFAVMHGGEIVEFFDSFADAVRYGVHSYKTTERFSVQEVTSRNVNLGYYSYAVQHVSN